MRQLQLWPSEQESGSQEAIWERLESGDRNRLLELLSQMIRKTAKDLSNPENQEKRHESER